MAGPATNRARDGEDDMKRRILFNAAFRMKLLSGKKTCTSRTKRCGKIGDTFTAFGETFEIEKVSKMSLDEVAFYLCIAEGFYDSFSFIECWKRLHPFLGWQPDRQVYVHVFRRVIV